jgi:acetyltransferase-like isoleucine patch superfamily enzyme
MKRLVYKLGLMFSYITPNYFFIFIHRSKNKFYSGWISRNFKFFGPSSTLRQVSTLVGEKYISIGENTTIGKNALLTAWDSHGGDKYFPSISIGNGCTIGDSAHITAINDITIGNNVLTGNYLLITDNAHGALNVQYLDKHPSLRPLISKGPVIIDDCVWIGNNVSILPGVHIGKGCIIGVGSVVTTDIPEYSIAVGSPAKIIKTI